MKLCALALALASAPVAAATTITFTEVAYAGPLTNQYAAFGITFSQSGGVARTRTYEDSRDTFDGRGIAGTPERGNPDIVFDAPVNDVSFDYVALGKFFFIEAYDANDVRLETLFIDVPRGAVVNATSAFTANGIKRVLLRDIDQLIGISTLRFTVPGAAVPETASWALMIAGFGALGAVVRVRRSRIALHGALA